MVSALIVKKEKSEKHAASNTVIDTILPIVQEIIDSLWKKC